MNDSIDKKSNEKRDNLDVDLDAMLDKAESSLLPMNDFQDDEDAIDRLLMDAGFDMDDELMQPEAKKDIDIVKDIDLHDELDDFLSFDGFGDDFNKQEKTQAAGVGLNEAAGNSSFTSSNEHEEDAIDRLLMNAGFDAADEPTQEIEDVDAAELEELNDFSDFSDFNEPEIVPVVEIDEPEPAIKNFSMLEDDVDLADEIDHVDESDMIQEDEVEASAPAMAEIEESYVEDDVDVDEELDHFSDFSDFNEPDIIPAVEVDEPEYVAENLSAHVDDAGLPDDVDDFSSLNDDFNESDLIQDDEDETSASTESESSPAPQAAVEQLSDDEDTVGLPDEIDGFSSFGDDFNESDLIQDDENETSASTESESSPAPQAAVEQLSDDEDTVGLPDEIDGFSSLGDDFNESDLIQDDENETSASTESEPSPAPQAAIEQLSDDEDNVGLPDEVDDLFGLGDDFNESDLIQDDEDEASASTESESSPAPQAAVEQLSDDGDTVGLPDEVDDLFGLGDDFNESDMIQDDDVEALAPVESESNQRQKLAVEEPFNDLQNENSFDSLLMDAGFDAEDEVGQTVAKTDAIGDDVDLSEIDDFFQLDEVSDDFSNEKEQDQLAETDEPSTQDEDDFLLPDFDITADMEVPGMGGSSGIKEDELADVFGDTDFLNEDEVGRASFEPEIAELKPGDNEAIFDSQAKQAGDTAIEDFENTKTFEQEEIKKQLEDAENRVKKAKRFSYVAIGLGAVALSAAAGLGVMIYNAKSEVSKLTEQVSTLEASLAKNSEKNPNEEINAVMNSVVQLNQQVYGFITELKGNPQFPVDLLTNKVPDIAAKQSMVSKALDMLQVKMGEDGKELLKPSAIESPKIEIAHEPAAVKEVTAHEPASVKTDATQEHAPIKEGHEPAPTTEKTAHEIAPTKERAKHEATPAKVEAVSETAPVKVKAQPEVVPAKPITPPKAVFKEEPVTVYRPTVTGKWGVNLVALKQEWFAKSKAAEFARLGVFAEVIPVYEKNTTMYRLRVGGFKSKAEALSNTDRIKKTLNLDSVWVSDN